MVKGGMDMKELISLQSNGFKWSIEQVEQSFLVKQAERVLISVESLDLAIKSVLFVVPLHSARIQSLKQSESHLVETLETKEKEQG